VDNGGPLLLEEPELSLHPEVVRFLPQMFARMQRRSGRLGRPMATVCACADTLNLGTATMWAATVLINVTDIPNVRAN
jgi:hypothetical protein